MKLIIAWGCLLLVILPLSHAIASAFETTRWKKLHKKMFYLLWLLITIFIITLLAFLPMWSNEEEIAPNGETMMEHYEPKF